MPRNTGLLGVNLTYWDSSMDNSQTEQLVEADGLNTFRFPGGGSKVRRLSLQILANNYYTGSNNIAQFLQFIQAVNGTGLITTDYGSGSPQEAAAELAYLQGSPTDTTPIGTGLEWSDSANQWQSVNWGTVGYWASLRGASPLSTDDGLNFLRINHPAPFSNIKYWEMGNEEYGSWEIDHHGTAGPGGVSTGNPARPGDLCRLCQARSPAWHRRLRRTAGLPNIWIGIDSGDPLGQSDNYWNKNVLSDGLAVGFVPNFISDHGYMTSPGGESDSLLLNGTATDPSAIEEAIRN